ncbi:MAG: helix-turn-helix domain-containing protein [Cyclobacteriaceae bacterium]|nr:helix-turn-helix domain-containing protein [Cyclobacteriaceae bacterium]
MKLISITIIICITLFGLFGSFALFTKHGNRKANKLLGFFFLLWAFDFLDGLLLLEGFYLEYPNFALWNESFVFLYGPLLYFYTLRIARKKTSFKWRFLLHLIPFIISLTTVMIFFHTLPKGDKIEVLRSIIELKQPSEIYFFTSVIYLHFFSYIWLSKKHIRKTVKNLNNFYSHHNLAWLNILLNSFLVILTISVFTNVLQFNQSKLYFEIGLPMLTIVMALFVASVLLNALNRPFISLNDPSTVKYSGLRLDPKETEVILKKIINALKQEKLYLNPELNLKDLSEAIDSNSRKVSQVINDTLDKSFFDLINSYRIEAAKERFKKNKDSKLTVLEVMYDVGFNSKSSFNTQFKNRTGLTPSEYMKLN